MPSNCISVLIFECVRNENERLLKGDFIGDGKMV